MIIINLVGSLAAICTTIAFIPQAYQSYKTRDLSGISLPMYSTFYARRGAMVGLRLAYSKLANHCGQRHHAGFI